MKRSAPLKMKMMFVALLVFVFCISFILPAWAKVDKIGYINVSKIFAGYQKTKESDSKIQEIKKKKLEERDALIHEIRRLTDEQALLSDDARSKKQEEIDAKAEEVRKFDASVNRELGEVSDKKSREIFKDINDVVQKYGERKGFDLIFNDQVFIYKSPRFDLTRDILDELNRSYKANQPK